jgi:nitrate reductase gamma subunit
MAMTLFVYLAIYSGVAIFLAGCFRRILEYARLPVHLRWELYPVPHEAPDRVEHGGSYFESGQWWLRPQTVHHRGELLAMFREIVFLKALREFNRRLWLPSFFFHSGLYLAVVAISLSVVASLPQVAIAGTGTLLPVIALLSRWIAYASAALVLVGASLLLLRRITDPELRNYTKPADIFNLLFFAVTFALLGLGSLIGDSRTASLAGVLRGTVHFDRNVAINPVFGTGILLACALAAYIPFTHMSHFIAKYFTYHHVRWDDRRNERGSAIESKIAGYLTYRPTWAAAHIGADGKKTWAEIATTNPAQEVRK